jgi:hypothetical protein
MNETINQIQALHALVVNNYGRGDWLVPIRPGYYDREKKEWTGPDGKANAKLQIELFKVFGRDRDLRLDTLVAILPLMTHSRKPIEFDTTKKLLVAELHALLSWLEENGAAKRALEEVSRDTMGWSLRLRGMLGYIYRPFTGGFYVPEEEQEQPVLFGWPQDTGAHQEP